MKKLVKRVLHRVAPGLAVTLQSIKSRRHSHRLVRKWGLRRIDDHLVGRLGLTVADGPFAGMRLPAAARADHLGPCLLGTYESELHPWLAEVRSVRFDSVLDVGAKYGYYAMGLAQWFPQARVVGWDIDPWARRAMRDGCRLNHLGNLSIRGYLSPRAFDGFVCGATLIISDCEGFEQQLFGEIEPEVLSTAWMIIEIHEKSAPGVSTFLRENFARTHTAEVVAKATRTPPRWVVDLLGAEDAARAVSEARSEQTWLYLRPQRPPGGP